MSRKRKLSFLISSLSIVLWASRGDAHKWFDFHCCNDQDCRPIVSILELEEGDYITTDDGVSVLFPKEFERRPSHDSFSYACTSQSGTPRCLYIATPVT